ncbi:MAG: hypothetical protein HYW57_02785 [Ignavibacteriales bacterium]|nr:hypothetical protein [Ignavibacteriales bacterium]
MSPRPERLDESSASSAEPLAELLGLKAQPNGRDGLSAGVRRTDEGGHPDQPARRVVWRG